MTSAVPSAYIPRPVRSLQCCCCGCATRGRQWWNRDTGYGVCDRCAAEQAGKESPERMESLYGRAGEHYLLAGS